MSKNKIYKHPVSFKITDDGEYAKNWLIRHRFKATAILRDRGEQGMIEFYEFQNRLALKKRIYGNNNADFI
jgi:hypothetical protein